MTEPHFNDSMTIAEAKVILRPLADTTEGHPCPLCRQLVKIYKRTIYATVARDLIALARHGGWEARGWVHVQDKIGKSSPDLVKTRWWGLVERQEGTREDGSSRVGLWRMTENGLAFVRGSHKVLKYAKVYDNRVLGYDGPHVSIQDCLGRKFSYNDLMHGV